MPEIFIYSNGNDVKVSKIPISTEYEFICEVRFYDSTCLLGQNHIHIHNEIDFISCRFYFLSEKIKIINSISKCPYFEFKNDSMKLLFHELFNKLEIVLNNLDEIANEMLNLINIINRYNNKYYNEYCSFIEKISNDIPFKTLPKSAII